MKNVKLLFIYLLSFVFFGCSNLEVNSVEWNIQKGIRSYIYNSNKKISQKYFEEVVNSKSGATIAQIELAYKYLAMIALTVNNIDEAISLLNESEEKANLFPYKYEILAMYFNMKKDFIKSEKYNKELVNWIDDRISEVKVEKFNVDILKTINLDLYSNRKFDNEYLKMYDKKEPKKLREDLYIKYLNSKKEYALKALKES